MDRFEFTGKSALVTGAASGIGAELALGLARLGVALALVDRDEVGLERVLLRARELGAPAVTTYIVDLSDGGDRLDLVADVLAAHGAIDLLVNNAGVALGGDFERTSMDDFDWIMEINFRAVVRLTKAALPALRTSSGAHIVNISSLFGLIAPADNVAYSSSKFAVRGFTEGLRSELAPHGIGVTVVHPGGIKTNIARNARVGPDVSPDEAARTQRLMAAILTMPPEIAATQILDAVASPRPRLVITRAAKLADVIVRVTPTRGAAALTGLTRLARRVPRRSRRRAAAPPGLTSRTGRERQ